MNRARNKTSLPHEIAQFQWYTNKKMFGIILLLATLVLATFTFVPIPGLTTISAYTFGMLFGFFTPLWYVVLVYVALVMILGPQVQLKTHWGITTWKYLLFVFGIMLFSVSISHFPTPLGRFELGAKPWNSFEVWFNEFSNNQVGDWWMPVNTHGGIIAAFLYALFASFLSSIGALIMGLLVVLVILLWTILPFFGFQWSWKRGWKRAKSVKNEAHESSQPQTTKQSSGSSLLTKQSKKVIQNSQTHHDIDFNLAQKVPVIEIDAKPRPKVLEEPPRHQAKVSEEQNDLPFDDPFSL